MIIGAYRPAFPAMTMHMYFDLDACTSTLTPTSKLLSSVIFSIQSISFDCPYWDQNFHISVEDVTDLLTTKVMLTDMMAGGFHRWGSLGNFS
jgi:hypothetical protein